MNKAKNVINIYNKVANKYADLFDKDLSDNQYLDKFLSHITNGKKILDLGCGTGRIASYYTEKGFNVTGVYLSEKMLEIAKNKHPNIDFRLGDIKEIKSSNKFDGVSLAYSLFHLEKKDVPKIIKKLAGVLNSSGIILIILQEGNGETYVDEPLLPGEKMFLSLFTEEEIKQYLLLDFKVLSVNRKKSNLEGELPYNKLIVIAKKR